MEQPYSQMSYSPWADRLSKFHTWPEFIQGMWLVMRGLRDIAAALRGRGEAPGRLVYGVIEDAEGRLLAWRDGEAGAVENGTPLLPPTPSSPGLSRGSTSWKPRR